MDIDKKFGLLICGIVILGLFVGAYIFFGQEDTTEYEPIKPTVIVPEIITPTPTPTTAPTPVVVETPKVPTQVMFTVLSTEENGFHVRTTDYRTFTLHKFDNWVSIMPNKVYSCELDASESVVNDCKLYKYQNNPYIIYPLDESYYRYKQSITTEYYWFGDQCIKCSNKLCEFFKPSQTPMWSAYQQFPPYTVYL
jgi:hypothetical protein